MRARSFGVGFGSLVVACSVLLAGLAQAQETTWIEARVIQVKPDCVAEWRELQKNGVGPALQKAGTEWRAAYTAAMGNSYEFVFVTPIPNFAWLDDRSPDFPEGLIAKVDACHQGRQVYAQIYEPELSARRDRSTPPKLAVVNYVTVVPGMGNEYRELLKTEVMPAIQKVASGFEVYRTIFGGPTQWLTVRFIDKMADIDEGPALRRSLGDDGFRRVNAMRSRIVSHRERTIMRFEPELSFGIGSASTSNQDQN